MSGVKQQAHIGLSRSLYFDFVLSKMIYADERDDCYLGNSAGGQRSLMEARSDEPEYAQSPIAHPALQLQGRVSQVDQQDIVKTDLGFARSCSQLSKGKYEDPDQTIFPELTTASARTENGKTATKEPFAGHGSKSELQSVLADHHRSHTHRNNKGRRPRTSFKERRLQANERERKRMQDLKDAFASLRKHLPAWANDKQMSKYDTLLLAQSYISALQSLLDK